MILDSFWGGLLLQFFCIIYGIVIENAQAFLNTGRYFEYFDIIANIIGSLLGSLVYHFIRQK